MLCDAASLLGVVSPPRLRDCEDFLLSVVGGQAALGCATENCGSQKNGPNPHIHITYIHNFLQPTRSFSHFHRPDDRWCVAFVHCTLSHLASPPPGPFWFIIVFAFWNNVSKVFSSRVTSGPAATRRQCPRKVHVVFAVLLVKWRWWRKSLQEHQPQQGHAASPSTDDDSCIGR